MAKSMRHRCRILSMQALYALEFGDKKADDVFSYILNDFGDDVHDDSFARLIFNGVIENKEKIDEIVKKAAPDWPLEKIASMDLTILRIGIFEIMFNEDIPDLVAINEAIEVTKEYGGYNNAKFINGVLSNVMLNKGKYIK